LAWHEREFNGKGSFAYAVHEGGEYVGCFYLNRSGSRRSLSEELLEKYDVDACWWVTIAAYERGLYEVLLEGLKKWLEDEFPFERPLFSNKVIPGQDQVG
jgi:hypothetical protein